MDLFSVVFEMIESNIDNYSLLKGVKIVSPDQMLVDCNYAKSATVTIHNNEVIIDSDDSTKKQLAEIITKLIEERKQK